MSVESRYALEVEGISKRFGATRALSNVSLAIGHGEIHGLLGENGAGKSTLMKVLAGVVVPDAGRLSIDGSSVPLGHPSAVRAAGLAMAYQELSAPPNITVAEKLFLPKLPTRLGFVSRRKLYAAAGGVLAEWGLESIDPSREISGLDLADKQHVELVAAMAARPKVLILDEPTASLPDSEWLFGHLERLAAEGTSVIYISHKLPEIGHLCTHGTVLRNGCVVEHFEPGEASEATLVELMIGRSIDHVFPPKSNAPNTTETRVTIDSLATRDVSASVTMHIDAGEVVGIAAVEGQGQRELFYCLAGLRRALAGSVTIQRSESGDPVSPGFSLVPEDRKTEGLFLSMSTRFNLTISELATYSRFGYVSRSKEAALASSASGEVNLPVSTLDRTIGELSGGNQQKALFGRAILANPQCLLLFDPTRGVDAATKVEIYHMIRRYVDDGGTVLIYSTEIPELVGLCDRVYTMYDGVLTEEFLGPQITEPGLMAGALGFSQDIAS